MATYTLSFPNTQSSITVNYPDGLFTYIGNPKEFYQDDYMEDNNTYPDILIVPANGAFIDGTYNLKEDTTYWRKNRTETTFTISSQNSSTETLYTKEHIYHRYGETVKILNPILYCGRTIELSGGIIDEVGSTTYTQRTLTYTFTGQTNYFKSNADFYFICGNSGISGTSDTSLYIGTDFPTDKQSDVDQDIVSGYVIYDKKDEEDKKKNRTIYHIAATSLIQRYDWIYKDGITRKYSANAASSPVMWQNNFATTSNYRKNLRWDDIYTQGFNDVITLTDLRSEFSTNDQIFSLEGKYIEFLNSPLIYLSNGSFDNNGGWCVMQPKKPGEDHISIEKVMPSQDNPVRVQMCHQMKYFPFPDYDKDWVQKHGEFNSPSSQGGIEYYSTGGTPHYIVTTYNALANAMRKGQIKYIANNGMNFTNLYAAKEVNQPAQFVVDVNDMYEVPFHEYGTQLFPIFTYPICTYLKLNTDSQTDPQNVCGDATALDLDIRDKLDQAYGKKGYAYKNVNTWPSQQKDADGILPVNKEVVLLKKSMSKFKILYINCHGAKYKKYSSYACLSTSNNKNIHRFHFKHIKYLLDGSREDEYYFIYISSCYGGGVFEDEIHENFNNPNYIQHLISKQLKGNYLIWCGDCVNSTAWILCGGYALSNLYNIKSSETTYQEEADRVNTMVANTRFYNISLLVDFMQDNYEFMKNVLLDERLMPRWTEQTFLKSAQNAANLIIWYSDLPNNDKENHTSKARAATTYPILWLYRLLEQFDYLIIDKPVLGIVGFGKQHYSYYANVFKRRYSKRNKDNDKYLSPWKLNENWIESQWNVDEVFPTQDEKDEFMRYVKFFHDLYLCWNKMADNAQPLLTRNSWSLKTSVVRYFLDDIPGIYVNGTDQFKQCKFPLFPGYDANSKITDNDIEEITYTEDKYATGG